MLPLPSRSSVDAPSVISSSLTRWRISKLESIAVAGAGGVIWPFAPCPGVATSMMDGLRLSGDLHGCAAWQSNEGLLSAQMGRRRSFCVCYLEKGAVVNVDQLLESACQFQGLRAFSRASHVGVRRSDCFPFLTYDTQQHLTIYSHCSLRPSVGHSTVVPN